MLIKYLNNNRGSALLLVTVSLTGIIAMAGLVLDGGSMYAIRTHLQKTANAAALSAAQELAHNEQAVRAVATEVLTRHNELDSLVEVEVQMMQYVEVTLSRVQPLAFSRLFGRDTADIQATARAGISAIGSAYGAAPLGIDESIELEHYKTYHLKVDETGVDTGNFGVLALGGPGANTYEDNLLYGYQGEIRIGDILETQTGNIAGKTRNAIKTRIDNCPYPADEYHHRDSSRLLLVPVYRPYNHDQNQMKEIEVVGFAWFYITEPMDSKDTSVIGMFIERAGGGSSVTGAVGRGAYAVKLIR